MLLEILATGPIPAFLLILVLALTLHILKQKKTFNKRVALAAHLKQKELDIARRLNKPLTKEYNNIKRYAESEPKEKVESIALYDNNDDADFDII